MLIEIAPTCCFPDEHVVVFFSPHVVVLALPDEHVVIQDTTNCKSLESIESKSIDSLRNLLLLFSAKILDYYLLLNLDWKDLPDNDLFLRF